MDGMVKGGGCPGDTCEGGLRSGARRRRWPEARKAVIVAESLRRDSVGSRGATWRQCEYVVGMARTGVGGRHDEERAGSRADCLGFRFCAGEGRRKGTAARYSG